MHIGGYCVNIVFIGFLVHSTSYLEADSEAFNYDIWAMK